MRIEDQNRIGPGATFVPADGVFARAGQRVKSAAGGSEVQAVILAAGRGSRLAEAIGEGAKCLAEVGGKALIEHQLEQLAQVGVTRVAVITGYLREQVVEVVGNRATCIHNPDWADSNSLYSLSLARDWVDGALLVFNCDVLADPQVLRRLIAGRGNVFAYDSSSGTEDEHMKVELDARGQLEAMSKCMPAQHSRGENVGMLHFEARTARLLFREAESLLAGGAMTMWLAAAVERVARFAPLRGIDVADLAWVEIDYPQDLVLARESVWPQIAASSALLQARRASRARLTLWLAGLAARAAHYLSERGGAGPEFGLGARGRAVRSGGPA